MQTKQPFLLTWAKGPKTSCMLQDSLWDTIVSITRMTLMTPVELQTRTKSEIKRNRKFQADLALLQGHFPLLQEVLQVQVENINAFGRQVDTVGSIQTCVRAAPDVVVGQRGSAQVRDNVLNPAVHCCSDQIHLLAVTGVAPHPARKDAGPYQDAMREDAPHGCQVLLDGGQQVGGTVGTQIVATQMQDENIRVGPGDLQLVELRQ